MYKLIVIVGGSTLVNLETEVETIANETYERVLKAGAVGGNDYSIVLMKDGVVVEKRAREKGMLYSEHKLPEKAVKKAQGFFRQLFA